MQIPRVVLPIPIRLRHVKAGTGAGAVTVLGTSFVPSWQGVNGPGGFLTGEYETRLSEEGKFTVTFPNGPGDDGIYHRERFLVITEGKRVPGVTATTYGGGTYRPGDEWIEVWWGDPGECVFVGTPTQAEVTSAAVTISGYDPVWLTKKARETSIGLWNHAPRDVIDHYSGVWQASLVDHFDGDVTYTWSASPADSSDGKWNYVKCANTGTNAGREGSVRLYPAAPSATATIKGKVPFVDGWTGFEETFQDGVLDPRWTTVYSSAGATVTEQNGRLELAVDNSAASVYADLRTVASVDARGRATVLEVKAPGTPRVNSEVGMRLGSDTDNVTLTINNGTTVAWKCVASVWTQVGSTQNVVPRFLRIRESDGTTYWAYSDDRVTWTEFTSAANPVALSAVKIIIIGGHFTAAGANFFVVGSIRFGEEPYASWRMEAMFTRSTLFSATDSLRVGVIDLNTGTEAAYVAVGTAPGAPVDAGLDNEPPGPFRIALEAHGRYIYCFANGRLVGHLPNVDKPLIPFITYVRGATTYTGIGAGEAWVDVDFVVIRRVRRFLMRGDTTGDFILPGLPTPDGLVATYYDDHDLSSEVSDASYEERVLAPIRQPYARRIERTVNGAIDAVGVSSWTPSGPYGGTYFSARWKGSIYLDLATYDYRFRQLASDRMRTWVSRTRHGEEMLNDWTEAGHAPAITTGGWLKADRGWPATSGWYPIVVEHSESTGYALGVLQIARSGNVDVWDAVGEGGYSRAVVTDSPSSYWRLNDWLTVNDGVAEDTTGSVNMTYKTWGSSFYGVGPVWPGMNAPDFDGTAGYLDGGDNYDFGGTANFTVEAWVCFDSVTTSDRPIVTKMENVAAGSADGWDLYLAASDSKIKLRRIVAGTAVSATSTAACVPGVWYHVVGVFNGTQLQVYLNNVAGSTQANSASLAGHTTALMIGKWGSTFNAGRLDGRACDVAIYSAALNATQIGNHWNGMDALGSIAPCSPIGVYEEHVRYDSHFDTLKAVVEAFGYQFLVEPKSLESGLFPGQLAPRVRVGRDTEYVLDAADATGYGLRINAEDVADTLLADAAGLADTEGAQLTAESINFEQLGGHMVASQEYTSLSEISFPILFQQRLDSMMVLRGSAWEEVSATPRGGRELLDSFPLTGTLAEFSWLPGDGVRLRLDSVGVHDVLPRQILGLTRQFVQGGMTGVTASFRQRPRNLREMLRQVSRTALNQIRNYQGQIGVASGTVGVFAAIDDNDMTRVVLPLSWQAQVLTAEFVVVAKSDSSTMNVEINGTNRFTVTATGRYDVRAYVGPLTAADKVMQARLTGGTGTASYALELTFRA